ncbi:MAG: glycosyltransferase family 2 protein [Chthoniobacterales bacterium]
MSSAQPTLSIVVPLYNSAATLPDLLERLCALEVAGGSEIVLVNDCSRDATEQTALALMPGCSRPVTFISLSRNYGEHSAVLAGVRSSTGAFVVTMDDDLQNPPEEVLKLLHAARAEKRDVIYSAFDRKQHSWWRNLGSRLTNRLADWSIDKPKGLYLSSFRCISRFVADEISKSANPHPYIDALIFQVTQNVGVVSVRHDARSAGESGYTMRALVRLWTSMLINSSMPLRLAAALGFLMSALGFVSFIAVFINHFLEKEPLGWGSLMAALVVFSGAQLLLLGIVGEYIGRIYLRVSKRPQSVVRFRTEHRGR